MTLEWQNGLQRSGEGSGRPFSRVRGRMSLRVVNGAVYVVYESG